MDMLLSGMNKVPIVFKLGRKNCLSLHCVSDVIGCDDISNWERLAELNGSSAGRL